MQACGSGVQAWGASVGVRGAGRKGRGKEEAVAAPGVLNE